MEAGVRGVEIMKHVQERVGEVYSGKHERVQIHGNYP